MTIDVWCDWMHFADAIYVVAQHILYFYHSFNVHKYLLMLRFLFIFPIAGVHPEVLLDFSQRMIEKFNYPYEMMPLLYVILKYAKGDLDEASKQLFEGTELFSKSNAYAYLLSCLMIIPRNLFWLKNCLILNSEFRTSNGKWLLAIAQSKHIRWCRIARIHSTMRMIIHMNMWNLRLLIKLRSV